MSARRLAHGLATVQGRSIEFSFEVSTVAADDDTRTGAANPLHPTGEDAVELAPGSPSCTHRRQVQNRVRGSLPAPGL
jgi:hypothetical protein